MKSRLSRLAFCVVVLGVVAYSVGPVAWLAVTSFKGEKEIGQRPPTMWPERPTVAPYKEAMARHRLGAAIVNSAVVAATTTLVVIPIAALAAYALARLRLRSRRAVLMLILVASMFPQITLAHTLYRMLLALGWLNAYPGLILPYVSLTLPLAVWILASFFNEIPRELEEAAELDGAGRLTTLFRIFLPVAAPGVFTAAILTFIYAWNEFFFALIVMTDPRMQTLPRAIALMPGRFTMPWGEISAASLTATLPLVLLVLFLQRRIVSGLTLGAVKQ